MSLLSTGKGASDVRLVVNSSADPSTGRLSCAATPATERRNKKKNGVNSEHWVLDNGPSGVAPAAVLLDHEW